MKVKCIDNRSYLAPDDDKGVFVFRPQDETTDVTLEKIYNVLDIEFGFYRIIDDSGEDYLYPAYMFEPIEIEQLDPPWSELFPVKIGPRLKMLGILLNDPILGEWWTLFNDPDKGRLYTQLWEEFFERCVQDSRNPTRKEIRVFVKKLETLLG
jgi:hypothetical protein